MNSIANLEEVSCNLCGLKEEKIIFKTDMGNVVRCKKCGLYYRTPRLSGREEIHKYEQLVYDDCFCQILNRAREKIFISALKKMESHKGRMLDIGCADGYFLALAKERGWETFGVELSQFFVKKAREKLGDSSIFGMPLKMARFPSDFFDSVTLWDVLDQLLDPLEELQEIKRILKKGGY